LNRGNLLNRVESTHTKAHEGTPTHTRECTMPRRSDGIALPHVKPGVFPLGGMVLLCVMAACVADEPTASRPTPGLSLGKAPPPSVTVTSTDPTYAFQGDSVLTVHVKGTGFTAGAHTSWPVSGDTTHVHEISTTYVSATEVVSTIKVDLNAPTALYDVVVTLVGGKKGVGAELFTVKSVNERQQLPIPIAVALDDTGPLGVSRIRSDGLGDYVDGEQTMVAFIDQFGNLEIGPDNADPSTPTPSRRSVVFDFSAPADPLNTYRPDLSLQTNFKILTNNVGLPRIQDLGINGTPVSACYRLTFAFRDVTTHHRVEFNPAINAQASFALITRTGASTWTAGQSTQCGANPTWGSVRSQDLVRKNAPLVFRGIYSLPLSMRIRAL